MKNYNCDILIAIHHKASNKIYDYQTKPEFDIEKVSELMLENVKRTRKSVKKVQKYKNIDYDNIKVMAEKIKKIEIE